MASQPHGLGSCQAAVGVCTHPSTIVGLTCMKQSLSPLGHLHLRSPDRHTACLPSPKQGSLGPPAGTPARSAGGTWSRSQGTGNRVVTSQGEAALVGG